MKVMKFGGISLKDAAAINRVKDIISSDNDKKLVVLSAFYGVTDQLTQLVERLKEKEYEKAEELLNKTEKTCLDIVKELKICKNSDSYIVERISNMRQLIHALSILHETTDRSTDIFLSAGEKISSFVFADFLNSSGIRSGFVDACEIMKTDSQHTKASVDMTLTEKEITKRVLPLFEHNFTVVTAGFIGSSPEGAATTLGRGGSDYSASVFSVLIKADVLEIWKDVDGIMTTDPKIVKNAQPIESLSYTEASELAFFGAKVLHPKTIRAAVMADIPVLVKKTTEPDLSGTKINLESKIFNKVKAIAFHKDITVINICSEKMLGTYGFLSRVFDIFTKHRTPVDLITTSEINISVTIENNPVVTERIVTDLSSFSTVTVTENTSIISLVGEGIKNTSGVASRCFGALSDINIQMVSMGASVANLSLLIDRNDLEKCVSRLHFEFFEKRGDDDK